MPQIKVSLPHNWQCRSYQDPLWDYLRDGGKRAVAVWHRRAGKDACSLHWASVAAMQRVGVYWHMLPTLQQGRRVIWDGITKDGRKMLDAFPDALVKGRRNDQMKLELVNGSIWQVVGSDNYDSLVGSNPVGVVFSEYSLADPKAWDFIRPILAENGGWALFIYTPRGHNHGYKLYETAKLNKDWFAECLTVEDTNAIPLSAVDDERQAGMAEEMIQQEFYCSFEAPMSGSYYGTLLMQAEKDRRICNVPHDTAVQVETWWDLGIGDSTAIWFAQRVGQEIHLIDYYENSGEGLAHYAQVLQARAQERGYVYSRHIGPHDAEARELGSGKTRVETMESLGLKMEVLPIHKVEDGIEAARNMLPKCWFDNERARQGLDALRHYHKEYDDKHGAYKLRPVHDWSSHGADAFRIGSMALPPAGPFTSLDSLYDKHLPDRAFV